MPQLFGADHEHPYPLVVWPEVYTALALRPRLGTDANGRSLYSAQREVLDEHGVTDAAAREVWMSLWASADEELGAIRAEELERLRDK